MTGGIPGATSIRRRASRSPATAAIQPLVALLQLPDGRLALVYGNRDRPHSICARLSGDQGESWSGELTLRSGGANGDLGYARAVVRDDGAVVAVYYFNDRPDGDGERFIEATIWTP